MQCNTPCCKSVRPTCTIGVYLENRLPPVPLDYHRFPYLIAIILGIIWHHTQFSATHLCFRAISRLQRCLKTEVQLTAVEWDQLWLPHFLQFLVAVVTAENHGRLCDISFNGHPFCGCFFNHVPSSKVQNRDQTQAEASRDPLVPGVHGHLGVLQCATVQKRPGDFGQRLIWDDV